MEGLYELDSCYVWIFLNAPKFSLALLTYNYHTSTILVITPEGFLIGWLTNVKTYVYVLTEKEPVFLVGVLCAKSYVGDYYIHYFI